MWITFKEALRKAQNTLPLDAEREGEDWVMDEVRDVSRKKQEA